MSATPVYPTSTIKRPRRTKPEIEAIRVAIYCIAHEDRPVTVRQIFYRLVSQGLIEKTEAEYSSTVVRLAVEMRRGGVLPFDWIADNTRWIRKPPSYSSLREALDDTARSYRRSLWGDSGDRIEIWCEKDALAGVAYDVTSQWDVPLMVTRGYPSHTYLYEIGAELEAGASRAYIYHVGDHDPSGKDIDRYIEKHLREYAPSVEINFKRIAVLPWQIERWSLPTRPTKTGSLSRSFNGESVDADAIPANTLRGLIDDAILRHVNKEAVDRLHRIEQAERESLERIALRFGGVE